MHWVQRCWKSDGPCAGAFYLGQFRPVLLGPVGPILACPFDHPKRQDEKKERKIKKEEKKKRKGGTINTVRVSVKASPAEGQRCST